VASFDSHRTKSLCSPELGTCDKRGKEGKTRPNFPPLCELVERGSNSRHDKEMFYVHVHAKHKCSVSIGGRLTS
jgi:hypothetical protein